jgi:translation initiation factor eIF-2B subunit epsilon
LEIENFQKCWVIGSHMIKQFDAQGSSESEEESEDGEVQRQEATETESEHTSEVETGSEKDTEEDRHSKRRNTVVGPSAGVAALAVQRQGGTQNTTTPNVGPQMNPRSTFSVESESDGCLSDSTDARDAGISASEESSAADTEDEESELTD